MQNNQKFAQLQPFALSGAGASLGATSITLQSMTDIDGNALTMAGTFGAKGWGTLEPGNGTLEEQISFTGLVNNANGTTTLTGVSNVAFVYPYTETSGLAKTHAGSTSFVISNTAGFYDAMTSNDNDEVITGTWTFTAPNYPQIDTPTTLPTLDAQFATKKYVDGVAVAGAPNAALTVKGIVQLPTQAQVDAKTATGSTGASLALTPDKQRSTLLSDYVVDTGAANAYVITPSPAITAYTAGQIFTFKAAHANTTASTLNVSGLGTKNIYKAGSPLSGGEMVAYQVFIVVYDGTQFELFSQASTPTGTIAMFVSAVAPGGWLNCDGSAVSRTTYAALYAVIGTSFGVGDGSTTFNVPDFRSRTAVGLGTGTKVFTFASRATNTITVTGAANSATNELQNGQVVTYHTSSGVMTGLTNDTVYYLIRIAYNQFQLATTLANAMAPTPVPISLSSDGSGTQTFTEALSARTLADTGGEEAHANSVPETSYHTHPQNINASGSGTSVAQSAGAATTGQTGYNTTSAPNSALATPHNTMSPFLTVGFIIKI